MLSSKTLDLADHCKNARRSLWGALRQVIPLHQRLRPTSSEWNPTFCCCYCIAIATFAALHDSAKWSNVAPSANCWKSRKIRWLSHAKCISDHQLVVASFWCGPCIVVGIVSSFRVTMWSSHAVVGAGQGKAWEGGASLRWGEGCSVSVQMAQPKEEINIEYALATFTNDATKVKEKSYLVRNIVSHSNLCFEDAILYPCMLKSLLWSGELWAQHVLCAWKSNNRLNTRVMVLLCASCKVHLREKETRKTLSHTVHDSFMIAFFSAIPCMWSSRCTCKRTVIVWHEKSACKTRWW